MIRTNILMQNKDTYVLNQIDLGGYIEVEFVRDMGVIGTADHGRLEIRGFEFLLTLSNSLIPPQTIYFHSVGYRTTVPLLEGREPGEKLRLRTCRFENRDIDWHQLVVNGEVMRGGQRRKVAA